MIAVQRRNKTLFFDTVNLRTLKLYSNRKCNTTNHAHLIHLILLLHPQEPHDGRNEDQRHPLIDHKTRLVSTIAEIILTLTALRFWMMFQVVSTEVDGQIDILRLGDVGQRCATTSFNVKCVVGCV